MAEEADETIAYIEQIIRGIVDGKERKHLSQSARDGLAAK